MVLRISFQGRENLILYIMECGYAEGEVFNVQVRPIPSLPKPAHAPIMLKRWWCYKDGNDGEWHVATGCH